MKKFIICLIVFVFSMPVYAQASKLTISVNDTTLKECGAFIDENDRTQVPVRAIAENLGFEVTWNDDEKTAYIEKDDISLAVKIGDDVIMKNGEEIPMDTTTRIINETTFVPLRFLSVALGNAVAYDSNTQTVKIILDGGYETVGISTGENTNPHGLFAQDFVKNGTPLTDIWYTPDDIPTDVAKVFEAAAAYTASPALKSDDQEIKEKTIALKDGNYTQDFVFNENENQDFYTETFFTTETGRIAVMIESDAIAADDLYVNLGIFKIELSNGGGKQAFPVEFWHKAFDKKAVVVFDDMTPDAEYVLRVSEVQYDGMPEREFSGTITIAQY